MKTISTNKAPAAIGPYSQAKIAGGFMFASGQIAIIPETGEIADGGIEAQTRQALENLKAILEEAGSGMDKVLKTTCFLADMGDFAVVNGIYAEYLGGEQLPSRSAVEVAALPKGGLFEIEAIAYI